MRPVLTKADFVRRYLEGEFGNASPSWNTLLEYVSSHYDGFVHLRNRVVGGSTYYNLSRQEAINRWLGYVGDLTTRQWYCSAMAPTHLTLIQGEVQRGYWGLDLTYSFLAQPMRDSLRLGASVAQGVLASFLLRKYMNQQSYEWLQYLLDEYEDHVVEFSVYDCEWGTVPGHNTVFWEVRCGY